MKNDKAKSIYSNLGILIDLALIIEALGMLSAIWILYKMGTDVPASNSMIMEKYLTTINFVKALTFNIFFLLVIVQLRVLFKAFKNGVFCDLKNVKTVRYISLLLLLYVIVVFIILQFIPNSLIEGGATFWPNVPVLIKIIYYKTIAAINFEVVFLSAVIYGLSFVFKQGCELDKTKI